MVELTLPVVVGAAIIDSINPCAIGVLLLLLAVLMKHSKDKMRIIKISSIYITVVFIVYMLSGLGLIWFQNFLISLGLASMLGSLVGILVIFGGIVEIKDFFWYGKGFSLMIPAKYSKKIKDKIDHVSAGSAIFLGAFVAMVELPCTGGPYLAITTLLAKQFDATSVFYLLIYNLIFVLPLIIIAALAYYHVDITKMGNWKKSNRKWMRLTAGILMILLGAFLIYYYNFSV
jgi:cytochrome c biogenesis protein CcdA